jgi:hypothetical protein
VHASGSEMPHTRRTAELLPAAGSDLRVHESQKTFRVSTYGFAVLRPQSAGKREVERERAPLQDV